MMGTPSNDWDGAFWRADVDEAAGVLLDIVRAVRPQVMVTYDANGFYGHPDHIQAHRVAVRAFELADGLVSKLYATAIPKSVLAEGIRLMRAAHPGEPLPGGSEFEAAESGPAGSEFEAAESVEDLPFGVPDDQVTTEIDARDYLDAKLAAMREHASQIAVDSPFFALSDRVGQRAFGVEYYTVLAGPRGPSSGNGGRESDLFAGID
jgi:N-acetyl-1-D-myo-inositol-2-amino-2-deoxy-alpha-D-glucopyranoside deacetylase